MALTRTLGKIAKLPLTTASVAVGVAKGAVHSGVGLVRHRTSSDDTATDEPTTNEPTTDETGAQTAASQPDAVVPEPQVVAPAPPPVDPDELPEPVVIYADDEPATEPLPDAELQAEDELVWTSESSTSD